MAAKQWNFDNAHSQIGFMIKHMMFAKVRGNFGEWSGNFVFDAENPSANKVRAVIDVASIDTGVGQRDDHLRSGDFFDIENFPEIVFESTEWRASEDGYDVDGALTIRDVTKTITLRVEHAGVATDPWGNTRTAFTVAAKINRKNFGLNWNQALEAGGVLVGEDVTIDIEVQATAAEAEAEVAAE